MKSEQDIVNMNYRALTLLGMGTAIMMELRDKVPEADREAANWFLQAINDVVYLNKPIPERPNKSR